MDYLHAALGPFEPQRDPQAALKFALNTTLMDGRLDELTSLLVPGSRVGALAGEPGWDIEREDGRALHFVARVDAGAFALAHPEYRCDRAGLWALLRPMLSAYAAEQAHDQARIERLLDQAEPAA